MTIGQNALVEWQKADRPFAGIVWGYFSLILGSKPLAWHLFALLTKWFCATTFWLMLRAIWPRNVQATAAIALLFLLYPGILQESRAFIFNFIWLQLALIFLSFSIMIILISAHATNWPPLPSAFARFCPIRPQPIIPMPKGLYSLLIYPPIPYLYPDRQYVVGCKRHLNSIPQDVQAIVPSCPKLH